MNALAASVVPEQASGRIEQAWQVLGELVRRNFHGHIVLEVSTRRARSRHEREELLRRCLEDIRACLRGEAVAR